jgi:hypothetical protein
VAAAAGFRPEGESGFGDQGTAGGGLRIVFGEPILFDFAPEGFVFAGQDGRPGAAAVFDGIQARLMRFGHSEREYRMRFERRGGKTKDKRLKAGWIKRSAES